MYHVSRYSKLMLNLGNPPFPPSYMPVLLIGSLQIDLWTCTGVAQSGEMYATISHFWYVMSKTKAVQGTILYALMPM